MQKTIYLIFLLAAVLSCKSDVELKEAPFVASFEVPEWTKNATIYEVNTRHYSPEGTLRNVLKNLPKLKRLGVDILWFMPIHPIGEEKRKGGLGSPYSIKDYQGLNNDLGTEAEFKNLINKAHVLGMKVILDWVANHSAFDNIWAIEHPEWYTQDSVGNIIHPKDTDWTDVADLNYDNKDMRKAMIKSMKYWVEEFDIDGFRCDVAGFVPHDFWKEAIDTLQHTKHLFMLAEWDDHEMHNDSFHMTYGWGLHHILNEVAKGNKQVSSINDFMIEDQSKFNKKDYRMNFTTNHDENSWNGTVQERMGDLGDAMTVLAFTIQGMPLLYSGQEANLSKRLSFFENDSINWSDRSKIGLFHKLMKLKHENEAIWNGEYGGEYQQIETTDQDNIFAFERIKGDKKVIVLLNLSSTNQVAKFDLVNYKENRTFTNIFTRKELDLGKHQAFLLKAGDYLVFSKK